MGLLHAYVLAAGLLGAEPGEPPAVATLIAALNDGDVEMRGYVAGALAEIGPAAVEPLKRALQDSSPYLRAGAAFTFGKLGIAAKPAQQQLLIALSDKDRDVRRHAAYALSRLFAAEKEHSATPAAAPPPVFPQETPR